MTQPGAGWPSTLVVFGITGDLTARKILPSLWQLHQRGTLPARWRCIGVSRRDWTDEQLRQYIAAAVPDSSASWRDHFSYQTLNFDRLGDYRALATRLGVVDRTSKACTNKLFYLAVPPNYVEGILRRLDKAGLTETCGPREGWTRVIVEKPFGRDGASAQRLDALLGRLFLEEQIYRIDHYLGKEVLQNILTFRFANSWWRAGWTAESIASLELRLWEKDGVEPGRSDTYDQIGALRDVGQNHLLQMLALLTMDDPKSLAAGAVRERRADLLDHLQLAGPPERGQYRGYRRLPGVNKGSTTETYFRLSLSIDLPQWRGVPILLESGKKMPRTCKEAVINFRAPQSCYLPDGSGADVSSVVFRLEPSEAISISFWAKRPGLAAVVEPRRLEWKIKEAAADYSEPYERLLLDCFLGQTTQFVSTKEVASSWRLIDQARQTWRRRRTPLRVYAAGSLPPSSTTVEVSSRTTPHELAIIGLGKMGGALAERLLDQNWLVAGWDQSQTVIEQLTARGLVAGDNPNAVLSSLKGRRRTVWLMLPAGRAIDRLIFGRNGLINGLRPGDTIIDGGNSHFKDTERRARRLQRRGILLIDVGVSGGPDAARWGASLVIGGSEDGIARHNDLWRALSWSDRSWARVGPSGAGHFAKMIHNAIEYGMMQSLAEGAALWRQSPYTLPVPDLFEIYNQGSIIESRLIDYLAAGMRQEGDELARVSGAVDDTGEGRWAVAAAEELRVPVPGLRAAIKWRRYSRRRPNYLGRVLALLRGRFGGHEWRQENHDK